MDHAPTNTRRGRPDIDTPSLVKLFDRLPPHALEAEMALLGSLILGPEMTADVIGIIQSPEQFYQAAHGAIYKAIIGLYDAHQSGDLVQLVQRLRDEHALDEVGGEDYLVQLAEQVPSAANAVHYARIVAEKAKLRRLIDAAGTILHDAYHVGQLGPDGAREVLDRAEMAVFEIAQDAELSDPQALKDLLDLELERIDAMEGTGVSGLATGYEDLDRMLRGLQPGELIIVAARPSMGKTALALNLAEQIAFGGRTPQDRAHDKAMVPVGVFSLEMSKSAVTQRLLSAYSGFSSTRFRDGSRFNDDEHQQLVHACDALAAAPIFIDDTAGLTIMQLRARARRLVAQHSVRVFFVDYLQLLTAPGAARESRQVEVSAISRQIKALARELNVPIVCLSQLNRASEQREGNRPRMSDLRESGSIEQDADVVALLHREEYYHIGKPQWAEEHPDKVGVAELIIAKQRNGPTGTVKFSWDNTTTRFKSYAPDEYDAEFAPSYDPPPARSEPKPARPVFIPGTRTGPETNFRDGGGPSRDDTGGVPF